MEATSSSSPTPETTETAQTSDTAEGILEVRENESRSLSPETQARFDRGCALLDAGELAQAVSTLEEAFEAAPDNARIRSALGLAIARAERNFEKSRALCEAATKQEFFNPDLYLNLARVYLIFERRSEAMRYLRRGQMIDPGHDAIRTAMQSLGRRRDPVVKFLPRRHPINRRLGAFRNLFEARGRDQIAA